jgi:hypothetical protein
VNNNIYTMLGAACSDQRFADLLFNDPQELAQVLNLTLSDTDLEYVRTLAENGQKLGAPETFTMLRAKICPPNGVCPWIASGCGTGQAAD